MSMILWLLKNRTIALFMFGIVTITHSTVYIKGRFDEANSKDGKANQAALVAVQKDAQSWADRPTTVDAAITRLRQAASDRRKDNP